MVRLRIAVVARHMWVAPVWAAHMWVTHMCVTHMGVAPVWVAPVRRALHIDISIYP